MFGLLMIQISKIMATNEGGLNQKINSYAAATNLVSCKWGNDKY